MLSSNEQQLKHNDCGISTVKIIYNLHHIPINRNFIEENIYITESGSSFHDLKGFFEKQQFQAEFNLLDLNSLRNKRNKQVAEKTWLTIISLMNKIPFCSASCNSRKIPRSWYNPKMTVKTN